MRQAAEQYDLEMYRVLCLDSRLGDLPRAWRKYRQASGPEFFNGA